MHCIKLIVLFWMLASILGSKEMFDCLSSYELPPAVPR